MLTLYSENLKETGKFDYLVLGERVILKWVPGCGPDLSSTVKDGVGAFVSRVMNLWGS